jgi:hypothetical protein
VTAIHRSADLALVRINGHADELRQWGVQPVRLAPKGTLPEVGDHVFAIGHPGAGGSGRVLVQTLSDGLVSAVGRDFNQAQHLQVTVPINPGNSGGPLFDDKGNVVGVPTFTIRKNAAADVALEALNFALEHKYVSELLDGPSTSLSGGEIAAVLAPPKQPTAAASPLAQAYEALARDLARQGYKPYSGDIQTSTRVFELAAQENNVLSINLRPGMMYLFAVVSANASDVDMAVFSPSGVVLASDTEPDARPLVLFSVRYAASYTVVIRNSSLSGKGLVVGVFFEK